MAWRNINVPIFSISQSEVNDFSWCDNPTNNSSAVTTSWTIPSGGAIENSYALGNSSGYALYCAIAYNTNFLEYQLYINGVFDQNYYQDVFRYERSNAQISYIACVDDDLQIGFLCFIYFQNGSWYMCAGTQNYKTNIMYQLLTDNQHIDYQWTSLNSVNGKGGLRTFGRVYDSNLSQGMTYIDSTGETIERFVENAPFDNLLVGNETDWFWAGELDRATVTLGRNGTSFFYTFKFYMAFSTLPFATFNYENIHNVSVTPSFCFMIDRENEVICPYIIEKAGTGQEYFINAVSTSAEDLHQYYLFFRGHVDDENPEDDPENTDTEDDGDDSPWEDIAIEGLTTPTASAVDTGFTTMYEVSKTELQNLASFMWSDSFITNVKDKLFGDPKDIIVGLAISPIKPKTEASSVIIKAGGVSTGISGLRLSSQYKLTDTLGSIYIKKAIKQRFLNYPPYMRIVAHLPFVGEHVLDVNDIMGKTISLKYIFDFLTGSCIAEIAVDGKPRYFFGGASGVQIPTSEANFSRLYSSILSAGATLGSTLSTMATGGLTAPMAIGAASGTLQNLMSMSPQVEYSSGGGAINGLLSSQAAYITVEVPEPKRSFEQVKFLGRPCLQGFKLKELHGFTKCMDVHLTDIKCTDDEKSKIYSTLTAGVLIETGTETPTLTPTSQNNICIQFMQNISEKNVIGKTWNTEADPETGALAPLVLEGSLVYEQSISSPKFTVQGDIRGYNYCYIPIFNRFYYVKDIQINGADVVTVPMEVDVLQSFKDEILECNAMIDRQEYEYNTYYNDSNIWCKQYKVVSTYPFVKSNGDALTFPRENNTYILTIAGGE